jgi:NADPH:quinone reductase-like Zn-dependent oxidoreductase
MYRAIQQRRGRLVGCRVAMATRNNVDRMRAVVYDRYGPPEVLRLGEVERPVPKDDEVLIKVHATTVNRTDTAQRSAEYFISRLLTGLLRPKRKIPGTELAGEVEAVGPAVTEFKVGDHVFGVSASTAGAHAEFVCLPESAPLAPKPTGMTFEEAAAVCDGAILALSYLRRVELQKRRRILIYGASGSIGTAGVQLAKYFDADVTAVCNTSNVELVRGLGADRVIDYTQEDFTKSGERYDVVFDAVGKLSFKRCKGSLSRAGATAQPSSAPIGRTRSWRCGPRGSARRRCCFRSRVTESRMSCSSRSSSRRGSTERSSIGVTRWRTWSRRAGTSRRGRKRGTSC